MSDLNSSLHTGVVSTVLTPSFTRLCLLFISQSFMSILRSGARLHVTDRFPCLAPLLGLVPIISVISDDTYEMLSSPWAFPSL